MDNMVKKVLQVCMTCARTKKGTNSIMYRIPTIQTKKITFQWGIVFASLEREDKYVFMCIDR